MKKLNSSNTITHIILNNMYPKKLFHSPWDSIRVVIGLFITILVGFILKNPDLLSILTVGAFLSGVLILIPHHSNRALVGISNSVLLVLSFFIGALLHNHTVILYILFFIFLVISGLLRKVGPAIAIKGLILTIFLLASAQMSTNLKLGMTLTIGIAFGSLIILICQLLPPYANKFAYEKQCISDVFNQLSIDAYSLTNKKRNTKAYLSAIHLSRNSLDSLDKNSRYNINFLVSLVTKAEIIEDFFNFIYLQNIHNIQIEELKDIGNILKNISAKLNDKNNKEFLFESEFKSIFTILNKYNFNTEKNIENKLKQFSNSPKNSNNIFKVLLNEINFKSPTFIQALRLAIFVIIATIIGNLFNYFPSISIPGHGFWVSLTTAIVLFPDYLDTFTRSIERTIGTIIGALLGFGISLIPLGLLGHSIIVFILLCGYILFRSSGQAWIMIWIVAWLCNLSVLHNVAIPRGIDTIVGCIIALIACIIWPTWNTNKIDKLLANWITIQRKYIGYIITSSSTQLDKISSLRHKSNLSHQQLEVNINKAEYEPVFSNSKWNTKDLEQLKSITTNITYQVSSLNIAMNSIHSVDFNIENLSQKLDSCMKDLSEFILVGNVNEVEYNIENLKLDINAETLPLSLKENLKNLILDIDALKCIVQSIYLKNPKE